MITSPKYAGYKRLQRSIIYTVVGILMIEDIKGGQNCNFGYINTNVILFGYLIYRIVSCYYVLCIELETWKKCSKKILFIHFFCLHHKFSVA